MPTLEPELLVLSFNNETSFSIFQVHGTNNYIELDYSPSCKYYEIKNTYQKIHEST